MCCHRVGIDSYCLNPLELQPNVLLDWVASRGGAGVQFSEAFLPNPTDDATAYLKDLGDTARDGGLYIEWGGGQHVPFDTSRWTEIDLAAVNRRAVRGARAVGATVVRSCSGGFFRWNDDAPAIDMLLEKMAAALRSQRAFLEDQGVTLAIELHFEFTTFELLRLFEMCDAEPGGWLGICLDTFNMLPMLEDPVAGTERVLPWIVATHIKDGAAALGMNGLVTFPTPLGQGQVDIPAILDLLEKSERQVNLSIECHGGSFTTDLFCAEFLSRFPDLSVAELGGLMRLAQNGGERWSDGKTSPTDRDDWPTLCEERTEADLAYLTALVADRERGSGESVGSS